MNPISRRQFMNGMALTAAAAAFPMRGYCADLIKTDAYVNVEITHGKIRGIQIEGVNIFKGIPYAGRVSGDRRFCRPASLEPWAGVRDALRLGAPAIQPKGQMLAIDESDAAEDCLFLNVWTPANDNGKRPVMFYNHGGGFTTGSGGSRYADGANLARFFDVVVVETNHRLGIMGFLYLDDIAGEEYAGSANAGLLDIVDGLDWVKKNISVFGGDPNNVMIFGESGGGAKTSCLYAMPKAAPYFNKASIESGPGVRMTMPEGAAKTTAMVLKELGISPKDWRKLLDVPAADLLNVQLKLSRPVVPQNLPHKRRGIMESLPGGFSPVVDGVALPNHPFDPTAPEISRSKPLMVGWNEDEYTFMAMMSGDTSPFTMDFSGLQEKLQPQFGEDTKQIIDTYRNTHPKASAADLFVAIQSVTMMGVGSIDIAEKKAKQKGAPVYLYNFGYKSETKIPGTDFALGSAHAIEISFKFNNEMPNMKPLAMSLSGNRPERFVASRNMAGLWTGFARTGSPSAADVPQWPAYNLSERPTLRIDAKCEVINNRFAAELDMWRSIGRL